MMAAEFQYERPAGLDELFRLMGQYGKECLVYGGGTDLLVLLRAKKVQATAVLDVKAIPELQNIREDDDFISIGAACTFRQIADSPPVREWAPCLAAAALKVGSAQIGYKATLAGNIQNASPAGDGLVAAAALDGQVELASAGGTRRVALQDFVKAPRHTTLADGEIITRVLIPKRRWNRQTFIKVGRRNSLAISVVNGVVALSVDETGVVRDARILLGAVAPTPLRLQKAEELLQDKPLAEADLAAVAACVQAGVSPIADIRASAEYRAYTAGAVVRAELERAREELACV